MGEAYYVSALFRDNMSLDVEEFFSECAWPTKGAELDDWELRIEDNEKAPHIKSTDGSEVVFGSPGAPGYRYHPLGSGAL